MSYNGYENYETWKICLNIDNDYGLYNQLKDFDGNSNDLKELLEETFEFEDVGYKICDFWSYNEWNEIDWEEVLETRMEDE